MRNLLYNCNLPLTGMWFHSQWFVNLINRIKVIEGETETETTDDRDKLHVCNSLLFVAYFYFVQS
jgi:hypothetical protein